MPQLLLVYFVPLLSFSHNTGGIHMYWIFPRNILVNVVTYISKDQKEFILTLFFVLSLVELEKDIRSEKLYVTVNSHLFPTLCPHRWKFPVLKITFLQRYLTTSLPGWLISFNCQGSEAARTKCICFSEFLAPHSTCLQHCLNITHNWQRKSNTYLESISKALFSGLGYRFLLSPLSFFSFFSFDALFWWLFWPKF